MRVSVVSRNRICSESIVRACHAQSLESQHFCDILALLDTKSIGNVLLWHFTADDIKPQNDVRALALLYPAVKIVALAPQSMCNALEEDCGNLLTAVLSESTSVEALISVLLLAEQGYDIKRSVIARRLPEPVQDTPAAPRGQESLAEPGAQAAGLHEKLSQREAEVLACLCAGQSNKAIARSLGVCDATVKAHLRSSFRRIGATNRTQAAIWANKNLPPFKR